MTTFFQTRDKFVSAPAGASTGRAAELTQASLAVLGQLRSSLAQGQKALLERDVEALERATREQTGLIRAWQVLFSNPMATQKSSGRRVHAPALAPELHTAASRVLYLTRVQGALLLRAQRFLAVLGNLSAGSQALYGPLFAGNASTALALGTDAAEQRESSPSCRV
jgi:hypothetical protein